MPRVVGRDTDREPPFEAKTEMIDRWRQTAKRSQLGASFWRLWAATAAANLADGLVLIGFPLVAAQLTRSPLLVSLVKTLATLPWLLITLPAGALADRCDRRQIMLVAISVRAVGLLIVAGLALHSTIDLALLYAVVLLLGIAEVFTDTTTQSVLPMVVPPDRLAVANGRIIAAQRITGDFLGAPLAGVLVGAGVYLFFGSAGLLYAIGALLLLRLSGRFRVLRMADTTIRADVAEALRYLASHTVLRAIAVLAAVLNFANFAYMAVFVLWATGEESAMQLSPELYGLLFAAAGAGAVLGALISEHAVRMAGEVRALLAAASVWSAVLLIPVWIPVWEAAMGAYFVAGLGASMTNVLAVTLRQRLIPSELLGRVHASYRLIGRGATPLGALAGGATGSLLGLEAAFLLAVGISLVAIVYASRRITDVSVRRAELDRRADAAGSQR